ncbi:hypothetical protein SAMN05216203_1837 [Marinobacter daqiaonensis]|uniref:Tetratricopeptide repeat-containing protein n=1 Tax=Marinobacter daqiaonensis TaxID=650891 RepID=A0A1I6I672_9GAMM|nr:hypothetical protein [Marinobacter daqiaonensis]SFR61890.1 hypothetical protein SAMN05216203_1837 [Marinobacter daqiaonensis]
MFKQSLRPAAFCIALAITPWVSADCVGGITQAEARQHWNHAQALERSGRTTEAVVAYRQAQGYVCGGSNPVELEAAQMAAPLARDLGRSLEQKGRLLSVDDNGKVAVWGAFDWYETGGHFSDADRVLFAAARANPDDIGLFDRIRQHFIDRTLPSFLTNNRARLQAVGGYTLDRSIYDRVMAMPRQSFENALLAEDRAFDENWLRGFAALEGRRPENPTDIVAIQQAQMAEQTFIRKWPEDLMDRSLSLLEIARQWSLRAAPDPAVHKALVHRLNERAVARGDRLLEAYADTPALLDRAIEFYLRADAADRVATVEKRAEQLGDANLADNRFTLAAEFYRISGNDGKQEEATILGERQLGSQASSMAASYEAQALQLQQMYSNPAMIEAMQKQAEEMMRQLQKSQGQFQQN